MSNAVMFLLSDVRNVPETYCEIKMREKLSPSSLSHFPRVLKGEREQFLLIYVSRAPQKFLCASPFDFLFVFF